VSDYNIEQLEEITGFARRTIRYYMQQGLVEAPFGARKTPRYTEQHVEQLLQIKKFKAAGLNLTKISEILQKSSEKPQNPHFEIGSITPVTRISIAPGVSIDIDREKNSLDDNTIRSLTKHIAAYFNAEKEDKE